MITTRHIRKARAPGADALQQAVAGDASALADVADNGPNSPDDPANVAGSQAFLSIGCQDFPSQITSFGQLQQQVAKALQTAPDIAGDVEAWLINAGCIGWPLPAQDPWRPVPVHGTPPILIVAGTYDPATSYPWALGLARQISGSALLTRSSDGTPVCSTTPAPNNAMPTTSPTRQHR